MVVPTNLHNIPSGAFKVLPKFEGTGKALYEHYHDVSHLASNFNITNETMMTHLLVHSFEGKVVEWFKTLAPQFITT